MKGGLELFFLPLPIVFRWREYLVDVGLVVAQIAVMRMLEAVFGLEGRSANAVGKEVFTEVENTGSERGGSLVAIGVVVAGPEKLRESSGTGPEFGGDVGVIDLLGPEGSDTTEDVLLLLLVKAVGEVVVVDALPGLVWSAPRATVAEVVEVGGVITFLVGVLHDVVAGVIGDVAAVAAVEVEEFRGGDDDVEAVAGESLDVLETLVPGLEDSVLGDLGLHLLGEDDVFPHDQTAVVTLLESRDDPVNPLLEKVVPRSGVVFSKPVADTGAEVVAVGLELVTSHVENAVREDVGKFTVDLLGDFVGFVVGNIKLARVGLDGGVVFPDIVGPPGVAAGDKLFVDLLPARVDVAGHINFGHNADTALAGVLNNLSNIPRGVGLTAGVSILSHLRVLSHLDRPRLGVTDVPVDEVKLGKRHGIDLLTDLVGADEVTGTIHHDTTDGIEWAILNRDGSFNLETTSVRNDNLLESGESVEGAPDGFGGDVNVIGVGGNIHSVRLIDAMVQRSIKVSDVDVDFGDFLWGALLFIVILSCRGSGGSRAGGSLFGAGERVEGRNRSLGHGRRPLESKDRVVGALPSSAEGPVARSIEFERGVEVFGTAVTPCDGSGSRQRVGLDLALGGFTEAREDQGDSREGLEDTIWTHDQGRILGRATNSDGEKRFAGEERERRTRSTQEEISGEKQVFYNQLQQEKTC